MGCACEGTRLCWRGVKLSARSHLLYAQPPARTWLRPASSRSHVAEPFLSREPEAVCLRVTRFWRSSESVIWPMMTYFSNNGRRPPHERRVHHRDQGQRQGDEGPFDPPLRHPAQSQLHHQSQVTGHPKVAGGVCVSPKVAIGADHTDSGPAQKNTVRYCMCAKAVQRARNSQTALIDSSARLEFMVGILGLRNGTERRTRTTSVAFVSRSRHRGSVRALGEHYVGLVVLRPSC